ncbi:MAG TPA: GGDEF domain-containing protein, partial [Clostridia bacterium]
HVPEESDLLFAYAGERRYPQAENVRFPTADLLPDPFPSYSQSVIDLIKPLFFRDEQYGYIILEAIDDDTRNFEALRGQIADSLKFALMMNQQKETEAYLDETIGQLRESNLLLKESAIRDPLTGRLSRRGFFEVGEKYLGDHSCDGADDLLVYIDIDRLKEINRMHGYPEGDRLIRATADILSRACPDDAILSRFCGDEFVILVKKASEEHFDALRSRICGFVEQHRQANRSQLEIYIGHTVFTHGPDVSLENVIRQADIDLYARKRSETRV